MLNVDKKLELTQIGEDKESLNIISEMEDGYAEVSLDGVLSAVNPALCRILGYSETEMVGSSNRRFTSEETAKKGFSAYNRVFRTGKSVKSYVYEAIRKDGEKRLLDVSISLVRDQLGKPCGFRGIFRDITERKKAQDELAAQKSRLEAIFSSVKEGIITVDTEMNIIEINQAGRDICGLISGAKIGQPFPELKNHCDRACLKEFEESLQRKATLKEHILRCKRNPEAIKTLILSSAAMLDSQGEKTGAILVVRDVSRERNLEQQLIARHQYHNIIGKNSKMLAIYALVGKLTNLNTTVLVTGENGTGKELVAKALHFGGNRALEPLVTVNCSALAENLLESELFGHVKGAFTGATGDSAGRFKIADKGTLLLDEIGDISPRIQLKLLRVLQEKEFEPVGSSKSIKVDVRLVACTNRDLKTLVANGEFREDLYYRLKVIEVNIPPLRERQDDIPLLFDHFRNRFNESLNKRITGADEAVMKALLDYNWPGNIRELEHAIERAFILCHGRKMHLDDLPAEILQKSVTKEIKSDREFGDESARLLEVLEKTGWNKAKAARVLGISRPTVYQKIKQHQLKPKT